MVIRVVMMGGWSSQDCYQESHDGHQDDQEGYEDGQDNLQDGLYDYQDGQDGKDGHQDGQKGLWILLVKMDLRKVCAYSSHCKIGGRRPNWWILG